MHVGERGELLLFLSHGCEGGCLQLVARFTHLSPSSSLLLKDTPSILKQNGVAVIEMWPLVGVVSEAGKGLQCSVVIGTAGSQHGPKNKEILRSPGAPIKLQTDPPA